MKDTKILDEENNIEIHKKLFYEFTNKIINNDKYQQTLIVMYCITTFICVMVFTMFPKQKNLPEYICLDSNREMDLLKEFDFNPSLNFEQIGLPWFDSFYCSRLYNPDV